MGTFDQILSKLPERHKAALEWFIASTGVEHGWPPPLSDGTLLVTKAKGIYKPRWSGYALSVREALSNVYPDHDPILQSDGTWTYRYFQESKDLADRDRLFTNRAMLACLEDHVPVGVMRQTQEHPQTRYNILGLAFVKGWEDGYFLLESLKVRGP